MNIPRRVAVVCVVLVTIGLATSSAPTSANPNLRRGAGDRPAAGVGAEPSLELVYQEAVADAVGEHLVDVAVTEYVHAVQMAEVVTYVNAVAEAEAAQARRTPPANRAAPAGNTVGECTGFAIPDYIIQRESGGNPSAMNPSGAYGCAQTLLSHYSGGSCSGLDPYTIEGQRQCVMILSNGGTNLDPWAETR